MLLLLSRNSAGRSLDFPKEAIRERKKFSDGGTHSISLTLIQTRQTVRSRAPVKQAKEKVSYIQHLQSLRKIKCSNFGGLAVGMRKIKKQNEIPFLYLVCSQSNNLFNRVSSNENNNNENNNPRRLWLTFLDLQSCLQLTITTISNQHVQVIPRKVGVLLYHHWHMIIIRLVINDSLGLDRSNSNQSITLETVTEEHLYQHTHTQHDFNNNNNHQPPSRYC